MFPVGSVYISISDSNPSSFLGGKWTEIGAGRAMMGADSSHVAGSTSEAGLPNITGYFETLSKSQYGTICTCSALYSRTDYGENINGQGYPGGNKSRFSFDASKVNGIYGRSTTVQPPAIYVHIWQRTA